MIDKHWALFLDRDGVLNRRIVDGYVTQWSEFTWLPGVPEALKIVAGIFGPIIVVSNQQGVGKGIMTRQDVTEIHARLVKEVVKTGSRLDAVYFSPHLDTEHSIMRKPNVGMGLKARREFPDIRFNQSVMAGDSLSDMLFGRRLGMKTVFLSENQSELRKGHKLIDFAFPDLLTFANRLTMATSLRSSPQASPPSPPSL